MAKKRKYTKRAKPKHVLGDLTEKGLLKEMAKLPPLILWMVWVTNAGRYFGPFTDPKDVCSWALQKVGSTGWRIEEIHHPSTK